MASERGTLNSSKVWPFSGQQLWDKVTLVQPAKPSSLLQPLEVPVSCAAPWCVPWFDLIVAPLRGHGGGDSGQPHWQRESTLDLAADSATGTCDSCSGVLLSCNSAARPHRCWTSPVVCATCMAAPRLWCIATCEAAPCWSVCL